MLVELIGNFESIEGDRAELTKTQFSLALRAFEPKLGNREGIVDALQVNL
jgi:hypothetical protein